MQEEKTNKIAADMLQVNRHLNELRSNVDNILNDVKDLGSEHQKKYMTLALELKTAFCVFEASQDKLQEMFYENEEITDIEAFNWHDLRPFILCKGKTEKTYFPKTDGEYLCVVEEELEDENLKFRRHYEIANWSKNLSQVDDSFEEKTGWWKWSQSLNKAEIKNVIAWSQLPHIRNNKPLV